MWHATRRQPGYSTWVDNFLHFCRLHERFPKHHVLKWRSTLGGRSVLLAINFPAPLVPRHPPPAGSDNNPSCALQGWYSNLLTLEMLSEHRFFTRLHYQATTAEKVVGFRFTRLSSRQRNIETLKKVPTRYLHVTACRSHMAATTLTLGKERARQQSQYRRYSDGQKPISSLLCLGTLSDAVCATSII